MGKLKQGVYTDAPQGEHDVLSLEEIIRIVWSRFWTVVLVVVVLTGLVAAYSFIRTPTYEASIKLLVGQRQGAADPYALDNIEGLQQLTPTLAEAVTSRPVAEDVIERLNLQLSSEAFIEDHLRVESIPETLFVRVSYRDTDPRRASLAANTLGDVFSERISQVSPESSAVSATVWEPATIPETPISPDLKLNVLLALILGVVLGLGLVFLLEYLDDSWRSPEETELISGVPNPGSIPSISESKKTLKSSKKEDQ